MLHVKGKAIEIEYLAISTLAYSLAQIALRRCYRSQNQEVKISIEASGVTDMRIFEGAQEKHHLGASSSRYIIQSICCMTSHAITLSSRRLPMSYFTSLETLWRISISSQGYKSCNVLNAKRRMVMVLPLITVAE